MFGQRLFYFFRIRTRLVDFINRHDNRNAGNPGMIDGLDGLIHDAVIGGHDQNNDIGNLRSAGPHRCKRLVTGGIQEHNIPAVDMHMIGADRLRDASRFTVGNIGLPDGIQQGGFAVIDMSHDGHHRSTRFEILRCGGSLQNGFVKFHVRGFQLETEFTRNNAGGIVIDGLIDGRHHAHGHQLIDNLADLDAHAFGQFANGNRFADFDPSFNGLGNGNLRFLHLGRRGLFPLTPFGKNNFLILFMPFEPLFDLLFQDFLGRDLLLFFDQDLDLIFAFFLRLFRRRL